MGLLRRELGIPMINSWWGGLELGRQYHCLEAKLVTVPAKASFFRFVLGRVVPEHTLWRCKVRPVVGNGPDQIVMSETQLAGTFYNN